MRNNNDRIFDLLSGTLSPAEEARLRQDIAADPELAEELRLQMSAVEWLGETETPALSEFETAQLRSAVRSSVVHAEAPDGEIAPHRSSTRMTWVFATAALILAVVGAVSVLPKLVGSTSADNVAIANASAASEAPAAGSRLSDDDVGATQEMAQATTTTAAAANTFAPAADAAPEGLEDGEAFAFGDLTAAEYLDMADSTLKRSTVASDYSADSQALEVCLQELTDAGFTSFAAEVSTYSGDVLFAERFDENDTLVEVVKIVIEGCAEIDRAP
jgi:hypothetical protein